MKSIQERKEEAKAYRKITPRRDLGVWVVQSNRPLVSPTMRCLLNAEERLSIWRQID